MALAIIFESVGVGEWFVLLAVILIVVGPKRLPATARKFGQYYAKFRRAADGFKRQIMEMDTEFENAVTEAERESAKTFEDVTASVENEPGDPNHPDYGDYDGGYDYSDETGEEPPPPARESQTVPEADATPPATEAVPAPAAAETVAAAEPPVTNGENANGHTPPEES